MSEDSASGPLDLDPELTVGAALARLRRDIGLSGHQLGKRIGMSQAKISRIETGAVLPNASDIRRLARTLGASRELERRLVEQAERASSRMTDWRASSDRFSDWQRDVAGLEAESNAVRVFQSGIVIGLLQTSEYARAVMTGAYKLTAGAEQAQPVAAVAEAVTVRVKRQELLADTTKKFHFVMPETVLQYRIGGPEIMPAQIERLRQVARQENVSVGIVPADARWTVAPYHGFMLLDRAVVIDLYNTVVTSKGESDLQVYRRFFDAVEKQATTEIDDILDRYLDHYLDLARPRPRR
jgi:transcriptional regulator with XRE-family HTH domain